MRGRSEGQATFAFYLGSTVPSHMGADPGRAFATPAEVRQRGALALRGRSEGQATFAFHLGSTVPSHMGADPGRAFATPAEVRQRGALALRGRSEGQETGAYLRSPTVPLPWHTYRGPSLRDPLIDGSAEGAAVNQAPSR